MKTNIILGDIVQDIYTGFKGVVLSKTEFVNGCIQFGIAKKYDKKDTIEVLGLEVNVDSQSLKLIKKGLKHIQLDEGKKKDVKKEITGGPCQIRQRRM